ncbi:MAG: hypothetical protein IT461_03400, partial [Planctomycetes bacterium]|nr:hypothetical protein [Planctomycetota bacterium]
MRKIFLGIAAFTLVCCAGAASAQTPAAPTLKSDDTTKNDTHDRGVGGVKMKLPPPAVTPPTTPPAPPPPPAPTPTPPSEGPDVP